MKPEYDECTLKWRVKGLGLFPTLQEAKDAIKDNELSETLIIRLSPKQMRALRSAAKAQHRNVSEFVRRWIKEVSQ